MKAKVKAIKDFLKQHYGYYTNSHNIEFEALQDSITVDYSEAHKPENKPMGFA